MSSGGQDAPMTRLLILCLCLPAPALACLWDRDTLAMETRRFPGAAKLIAGHFLQRSQAYFEWRLKDRRARIEKDPDDLAAYDDLAVALDKLGRPAEAIALMVEKETRKPGLYETAANRGTFHIHAGQFEEGLVHLRRALEINPDAHFGRERYQVWLVEYSIVMTVLLCRRSLLFCSICRSSVQPCSRHRCSSSRPLRWLGVF